LADHSYKCKYGTFLFDSEKVKLPVFTIAAAVYWLTDVGRLLIQERSAHRVKHATVSVWTHVLRTSDFFNVFYRCVRRILL